jgi:Zn finger protein HypA/HybF involved in hydrogenase expression
MEAIDYIDWDEGRDFAVPTSSPVDHCENCGRSGQRLTRVQEFDYMGCDDCMEEALAVLAREERDPIGWEGGFAANH